VENLQVIEGYLADCFGERLSMSHPVRRSLALNALAEAFEGQQAHRAKDGTGREVLVSMSDGVIGLTTYDHVGDNDNKLDELETVWFDRLVGATVHRRQLADRNACPVIALCLEHGRLPGAKLEFWVTGLTDEARSSLVETLGAIVGLPRPPAAPMVAVA
jgi:hypothetical protein